MFVTINPKRAPNGAHKAAIEEALSANTNKCILWRHSGIREYGHLKWEGNNWLAHRLVLVLTRGGPREANMEAAHLCGTGRCINPKHLAWKTPAGNAQDKKIHGTYVRGSGVNGAKLTEAQVLAIRSAQGSNGDLAIQYGVKPRTIRAVRARETWGWL